MPRNTTEEKNPNYSIKVTWLKVGKIIAILQNQTVTNKKKCPKMMVYNIYQYGFHPPEPKHYNWDSKMTTSICKLGTSANFNRLTPPIRPLICSWKLNSDQNASWKLNIVRKYTWDKKYTQSHSFQSTKTTPVTLTIDTNMVEEMTHWNRHKWKRDICSYIKTVWYSNLHDDRCLLCFILLGIQRRSRWLKDSSISRLGFLGLDSTSIFTFDESFGLRCILLRGVASALRVVCRHWNRHFYQFSKYRLNIWTIQVTWIIHAIK